ncbi:MAG TPA: hypothetical protein VHP11_15715 [Tepidisphaeraceae bacterium]|nr:hypothetical protein [Tepidisphaeraceae bacterium]
MGSPQPQFANSSSEQLHSQEPKKTIFNIERTPVIVDTPPQGEPATTSQPNASDAQRTPGPVSRVRKAGLNYIIVQSYPEAEMANEAVKVLSENGIDSTVERNLQGWSKDWHIVVGLEGFDRISNSARYDAYVKKIRDISEKYAKKSSFKAFAPTAIKWGGKAK